MLYLLVQKEKWRERGSSATIRHRIQFFIYLQEGKGERERKRGRGTLTFSVCPATLNRAPYKLGWLIFYSSLIEFGLNLTRVSLTGKTCSFLILLFRSALTSRKYQSTGLSSLPSPPFSFLYTRPSQPSFPNSRVSRASNLTFSIRPLKKKQRDRPYFDRAYINEL